MKTFITFIFVLFSVFGFSQNPVNLMNPTVQPLAMSDDIIISDETIQQAEELIFTTPFQVVEFSIISLDCKTTRVYGVLQDGTTPVNVDIIGGPCPPHCDMPILQGPCPPHCD